MRRLALALALSLLVAPAAAAQPTLAPTQVLTGPSTGVTIGGLEIARDGSGGLVFLAKVAGVERVFASRLIAGAFEPPAQLDGGLPGPSSQPVITGTSGGILQVAFIDAGTLYVTSTSSTSSAWSAPQAMAAGASNPAISMNTFGESYLAYTATAGGGDDVDVQYYNTTSWAPASPEAMNESPGDNAGSGTGAPAIMTAGDGVAIVAWGENGHVYSRRVWGTGTSVETEQLDPSSVGGWSEVSAGNPAVAVGGDSSYPDIVFTETVASGANTQTRAMLARLIAEDTVPAVPIDRLSPGIDSASQAEIAMTEYGRGFATAATDATDEVISTPLAANGVPDGPSEIGTGIDGALPYAVPAAAGLTSNLVAWQDTTALGSSEVVVRYAQDGIDLGPTTVLSSPSGGSTDAAAGLVAGGDANGDAAVAWVQGPASAQTVDLAQLFQPPGSPTAPTNTTYTNQVHPTLSWTPPHADWGPLLYTVTLDGTTLGQTYSSSIAVPNTLIDGPHVWQVKVSDPAGLTGTSGRSTVFVDTQPPRLRILLSGTPRVHQTVTLRLAYLDPPNPTEPGSSASGIASVTIRWGRAAPVTVTGTDSARNVFTRSGLYRLTVTATDRAGNTTTIVRYLRILPALPAPAPAAGTTTASTTTAGKTTASGATASGATASRATASRATASGTTTSRTTASRTTASTTTATKGQGT